MILVQSIGSFIAKQPIDFHDNTNNTFRLHVTCNMGHQVYPICYALTKLS